MEAEIGIDVGEGRAPVGDLVSPEAEASKDLIEAAAFPFPLVPLVAAVTAAAECRLP